MFLRAASMQQSCQAEHPTCKQEHLSQISMLGISQGPPLEWILKMPAPYISGQNSHKSFTCTESVECVIEIMSGMH